MQVTAGQLIPSEPVHVLQRMYPFVDNLNVKIRTVISRKDHLGCLAYAHYEFIRIHPYSNGSGQTGRILMNPVAMKLGHKPIELCRREGSSRRAYIEAMKSGDAGNFEPSASLISEELTSF